MTYEQEMLARAMNHIDNDMILAAHGPRKKLRRAILPLIAVCLAAVFLAIFPYLREVIDTNSDLLGPPDGGIEDGVGGGTPDSSLPDAEMGTPVTLGGTTLTLTAVTDTTAAFEVVKTDGVPVYVLLRDRRGGVLASTEPNYKDNGVAIRPNTIRVYVNGEEQTLYQIPTAAGAYEIVVDFTSIRNGQYPMQEFMELYTYVGEEDKPLSVRFPLEVEAPGTDTVAPEENTQ